MKVLRVTMSTIFALIKFEDSISIEVSLFYSFAFFFIIYFMPIAIPLSPVPVTSEEWCQLGSESLTFLQLNRLLLFKCWIVLSTRPGLFKRWIVLPTG